jgi:methylenetetrahydrofolate reductase (NADPH)
LRALFCREFQGLKFILTFTVLTDFSLIQGDCRSNVPENGRNAVTWGVFPGQEVVQTTIIERESFLSWKVSLFALASPNVVFTTKNRRKLFLSGTSGRRFIDLVLQREVSLRA